MKRLALLFFLILSLSSCFFKKSASKVHPIKNKSFNQVFKNTDNEYRYKIAEQYYANQKYAYALQLFEDLFAYVKGTDKYEDMYYKSANCYSFLKDYLNAENFYKSFVETFPNSKKAEECEYLRAYCYYKQSPKLELDQTSTTKTMALMQAFINTHPTSTKIKEANEILDICRAKLEAKEFKAAELYFNLGYFKAAAISFENVAENFPDSKLADEYKYNTIKAFNKYAELSYEEKQEERYNKVLSECADFIERFSDSKHLAEVTKIKIQVNNILKNIQNEQVKKTN
jgi:outer membrane protein assembly factor BamD